MMFRQNWWNTKTGDAGSFVFDGDARTAQQCEEYDGEGHANRRIWYVAICWGAGGHTHRCDTETEAHDAGAREWGQGNFSVIEVDAETDIPKEVDRLLRLDAETRGWERAEMHDAG